MKIPISIKIVNEALINSGQEATFDYEVKSLLILIVEAAIRQGYVHGWEDHVKARQPKVTKKQLIDFAEIYKKNKVGKK